MVRALNSAVDLFRPSKASGYDGAVTYTKVTVSKVKLAQSTRGWTVDTAGSVLRRTATLYFNIGRSVESPTLSPVFIAGDIICDTSNSSTPSEDRLVVSSVVEQTFKGSLHHYEVVLV